MTTTTSTEAPAEIGTSRYTKWVLALFFVCLFIPGSFHLGIRMTPYRLYLMAMAIPIVLRALKDPTLRITAVDTLMFLSLFWQSLTIIVNHKTSYLVFAGASFTEYFLGYMLGRVFIRSASDFRFFFKCFLVTLLAFLPFALVELTTHQRVLRNLAGYVLSQPPAPSAGRVRFGLLRAQASFETFLVYGAFCAMGFSNVFYIYYDRFPKNFVYAGFVLFMTSLAISTSSLLTVFVQTLLIVYNVLFKFITRKWLLLLAISIGPLIFIRQIISYILNEVMFSPLSGQSRILHFQYGMREILDNPIFGIGMNRWGSPYWLSQATDNFWLAVALRNGVIAIFLVVAVFSLHFAKIALAPSMNQVEDRLRTGYLISLFSSFIMFFLTNFFSVSLVFYMIFLGGGAWFYNGSQARSGRGLRRRQDQGREVLRQRGAVRNPHLARTRPPPARRSG